MKRASHPLFLRRLSIIVLIGVMGLSLLSFTFPVNAATPPVLGTLTQVGSSSVGGLGLSSAATCLGICIPQACNMHGTWFVFWLSGQPSSNDQFSYSTSSDGISWSPSSVLFTTGHAPTSWGAACDGVLYEIYFTYSVTGAIDNPIYYNAAQFSSPSSFSLLSGSDLQITGYAHNAFSQQVLGAFFDSSHNFYTLFGDGAGTRYQENGAYAAGLGSASTFGYGAGFALSQVGGVDAGVYNIFEAESWGTNGNPFTVSYSGTAYGDTGYSAGMAAYSIISGQQYIVAGAGPTASASAGQCSIELFSVTSRSFVHATSGLSTNECGYGSAGSSGVTFSNAGFVASDGSQNVFVDFGNAGQLAISGDGGNSFTVYNNAVSAGTYLITLAGVYQNPAGGFQVLAVYAGGTLQETVFVQSISLGPSSASVQTQTVGSCPPGGGTGVGHYALTNSTIFLYEGNALGQEVVNTISFEVSSIVGSGSHTLQILLYYSSSTPASIQYPLTLAYSKSYTITSGTTNSTVTTQIAVPLNTAATTPLPFNLWGVGIVGDDHINIAGSSLSGLVSQTGAASTAAQPSTFTSNGAASTKKLAMCATGSYQNVAGFLFTTATTTVTPSTTVLVTATQTNIVAGLIPATVNYALTFFVILFPGIVLAFVIGVASHSPTGAGVGFVAGMTVGAGIGYTAGNAAGVILVPAGLLAIVLLVDIFILIGVFALGRSGGV